MIEKGETFMSLLSKEGGKLGEKLYQHTILPDPCGL